MKCVDAGRRVELDESGFTLPETLVTIMIMIVVLFALYSIFDMSIRVFTYGNAKTEAVENARLGIEKMEREIRAAYPVDRAVDTSRYLFFSANGTTSSPPKAMPTATQITFGNDLDGDGKVTCPNTANKCEYITYRQDGDTLVRVNAADSAGTGDPVVEFIAPNGLTFTYLKSDGSALTTSELGSPGNMKLIAAVRMRLDVTTGGTQPGTQTLTTEVELRNCERGPDGAPICTG